MTKKQAWVKALRLRTLPLSLSGIILGSFIAYKDGKWDALIFTLAMLTTILFQILSNLANDLGDSMKGADNAERIGPMRAVQSGVISMKEMKIAVVLTAILSLSTAIPLVMIGTRGMSSNVLYTYFGLTVLCILAAITYTIGKKAYGYSGLGDLFVFIFFGGVSVLGVYVLYAKELELTVILPAISIGLLSTAVLNLNNMRDIVNDKKVGKITLVVKMGGDVAKFYHALLIVGGITALAMYVYLHQLTLAWIGLMPAIVLIIHLRKVMQTKYPKDFDPELKKVALTTFAIAILMSIFLNVTI